MRLSVVASLLTKIGLVVGNERKLLPSLGLSDHLFGVGFNNYSVADTVLLPVGRSDAVQGAVGSADLNDRRRRNGYSEPQAAAQSFPSREPVDSLAFVDGRMVDLVQRPHGRLNVLLIAKPSHGVTDKTEVRLQASLRIRGHSLLIPGELV